MKDQNDLKVMLSQWRTQFPNLYLRAVRGDCSVTVLTKANPLTVAELAEEAGMDDVAEELVVAAEEIKPKKERKERKARKCRNHPDNFPL